MVLDSPGTDRTFEGLPAARPSGTGGDRPSPTGWVAAGVGVCAAVALTLGMLTPPRSGPWCSGPCLTYPYAGAEAFAPRDYWWMWPAVLTALGVVVLAASIRHDAAGRRWLWGETAVILAGVAAAVLLVDYAIQLGAVMPSLLNGRTEDLGLFVMYHPSGVFIALEDLGYLLMGAALLATGLIVPERTRRGRAARWVLVGAGAVVLAAFVGLTLWFGRDLADHFEIVAIGTNWTALILVGALLGLPRRSRGSA